MDEIWSLLAQILGEQESSVDWVLCRLSSLWQAALGEYDVCVVSCREKHHEGRFLVCGAGDDPTAGNVREFNKLASTNWSESVANQLQSGFDEYEIIRFRCNDRTAVGGVLVGINSAIADDDLVETLKLISANALRDAQNQADATLEGPKTVGAGVREAVAGATGVVAGRKSKEPKLAKSRSGREEKQDSREERETTRGRETPRDWQSVALDRERLESLAEFAAGAGHEINNPLGTIVGRVQLLLREETDIDRRQALSTIGGQAYRIRDMIGDAMLFARPPEPAPEWNPMTDVVEEVLDGYADDLQQSEFDVDVEFTRNVRVYADPVQLRVALGALVRNAIEAASTGGAHEMQLRAEQTGSGRDAGTVITLSDNGIGLTDEQKRHLFDPFYSGRQAGRGLGFGLSKCWRIVSNHGGTIDVEVERGWTTFRLMFPDSPD